MIVEAPVFGCENRLDEMVGEHVNPNMAAPQAAFGENGAVGGEHGHVGRPVVQCREKRVGHARNEEQHRACKEDHADTARRLRPSLPRPERKGWRWERRL